MFLLDYMDTNQKVRSERSTKKYNTYDQQTKFWINAKCSYSSQRVVQTGTTKLRNESETKRNEMKRNTTKRNEKWRSEAKRNEVSQNETKYVGQSIKDRKTISEGVKINELLSG